MQAQSWFNRAHVEQSKQAPGQLERKIRQEKVKNEEARKIAFLSNSVLKGLYYDFYRKIGF